MISYIDMTLSEYASKADWHIKIKFKEISQDIYGAPLLCFLLVNIGPRHFADDIFKSILENCGIFIQTPVKFVTLYPIKNKPWLLVGSGDVFAPTGR